MNKTYGQLQKLQGKTEEMETTSVSVSAPKMLLIKAGALTSPQSSCQPFPRMPCQRWSANRGLRGRQAPKLGIPQTQPKGMFETMYSCTSQFTNALPKTMLLYHHRCFQPAACCHARWQSPFGYTW